MAIMNLDAPRLSRVETLMSLKKTNTAFLIVAGMVFCLLLGCGGSGSATSSVTGNPVIEPTPEPTDTACQFGGECQSVELPQPPNVPDNPGMEPDEPAVPVITLPAGLLNEKKFSLVKAQQAWESDAKSGGYTGREVVIGVMEEVNQFHVLFGSGDDSKIHPDSVLTSLYPDNIPPPPEKYIADDEDDLIVNDKSQTGSDRMKKYPPVPCLLQFGGVEDCPDTSGNTKYFLRLNGGGLGVLPGLVSPNPDEHECPVFLLKEDEDPRELCSQFGALHGTGVAGVAAANSDFLPSGDNGGQSETRFQGVAYGADILVYARPLEIAGLPSGLEKHAAYFRNAPAQADVYTFSHTFSAEVTTRDITRKHLGDANNFSNFASIADAIREKDIPVIAATGNHDEGYPRFPAALPLFFPDLRGKILAVTAIRDSGGAASYANLCGILPRDWNTEKHGRHYCLAAPGGFAGHSTVPFWLTGPDNEEVYQASGTSFAVPVVAGAFAILKEKFRNKDDGSDSLSNKQLIFRLMETADRTRRYDGHAVYGAGLLDIEAAIMPVGTQRMSAFGDINEGVTYEFDLTSLTTSAAFGDALQRAFLTHEAAAFDELNAPFWYPLASLTPTTSSRETLQERHASLFEHDIAPVETAIGGRLALKSSHTGSSEQIDMSLRQPIDSASQAELLLTAGDLSTSPFGLHEDKSFAHPYLGFAGEGIGLGGAIQLDTGRLTAMGFTSGSADVSRDVPIDVHGGLIEYAIEPFAGVEFGMQVGAMVEESRALGLLSEGGFGELGESSTAFAGVSLDSELEDNWRFRASMLFGRTNIDEPSIGLLTTSSTLTSSAFRFALEGSDVFLDADRMDVFVAQPLRIEGGKADFTIPVGRTPSGLVRREQINGVSLEPGGRELEFGMRYEMQVSEDITATGGLGIVHEGGHSKQTETELYGLANLRFQF